MGESFHQAQDPSSRDEVGLHVQCLQHLVYFQHFSKSLGGKRKAGPCELPWTRVEQIHKHTKGLGQTVSGTTFLKRISISALLQPSVAPKHPCWRMLISTLSLWPCFSSPVQPWLFGCSAYTQCLPCPEPFSTSFDHLECSVSLVKPNSSFKAFLNVSGSQELC